MASASRRTVVVVGGGSAGVNAARALSQSLDRSRFNLVLINPRPYRVALPAALRMVVTDESKLEDTALIPYDQLFVNGNGTFKQGSVESIRQAPGTERGVLLLKGGEEVSYDALALAPGSLWEGPIDFPDDDREVKRSISNYRAKFAKAKSIVMAGGGAVGVELAGEIKDAWPDKQVTIVHGGRLLLNDAYPDKFRIDIAKAIQTRGINVVTGDHIESIPEGPTEKIVTRAGKPLIADLVLGTRGPKPNTSFISALGADVLTAQGFVKVKPTLQLRDFPNIFAAGDVIDWKEQKQAAKSSGHGKLVAQNIVSYLERRPLKEYKTGPEMIALTNGKAGGMTFMNVMWGLTFGPWLTSMVKSKTLLVPMFRKESGLA